jgi:hypothetical protein
MEFIIVGRIVKRMAEALNDNRRRRPHTWTGEVFMGAFYIDSSKIASTIVGHDFFSRCRENVAEPTIAGWFKIRSRGRAIA